MHAEAVADELLEDRLVPLALRDAAGKPRERARAVEAHLGTFEAERAGASDRIRDAEPAQLAALLRVGAAFGEARDVGAAQPGIEDLFEFATVVGEGEPGLERHRLRGDQVAPAQFHLIDA